MNLPKHFLFLLGFLLTLSGCGGGGHSAAPPSDLTATPGDGRVTLTWTMQPNVQYALYYAATPSITVDNWTNISGSVPMFEVHSPLVIYGLTNATTYGFVMTGRVDNGPAGVASPTVTSIPRAAGTTWTRGSTIADWDANAATYGLTSALFVAVGDGGKIATSPDTKTWTILASIPTTANLNGVTSIGANYVAGGASGTLLYSTDGTTWAQQTSGTTNTINALASNGSSMYVAVGASGTILYSTTGTTWTTATAVTTNDLLAVTYGNAKWIATGKSGTLLTSADGITWTAVSSGTTADLKGIAYGVSASTSTEAYVSIGANGVLLTSTDAATWTNVTTAGLPAGLNSLTHLSQFVAVGDNGVIYTSTSGTVWQAQVSGTTAKLKAVTNSNYGYLAVGAAGVNLLSI